MSTQRERASAVTLWLRDVQRRAWPQTALLLTRSALYRSPNIPAAMAEAWPQPKVYVPRWKRRGLRDY